MIKIGVVAVDDSKTIQRDEVDAIVRKLCVSYSSIRRSFFLSETTINLALDEKKVTKAVDCMAKVYGFNTEFVKRVGYSASIQSFAAFHLKYIGMNPVPVQGTILFQQSRISLCGMPRYSLLHIIAHELAHGRMYCDLHELSTSEFATDVLALLVAGNARGFSKNMYIANPCHFARYGYIRPELHEEVFRCLAKYAPVIYL